jgi:hypothetical protein
MIIDRQYKLNTRVICTLITANRTDEAYTSLAPPSMKYVKSRWFSCPGALMILSFSKRPSVLPYPTFW